MTIKSWNSFLDKSLADTHLSRSEKKGLNQILESISGEPRQITQFRTLAFEKARLAMESRKDIATLNWLEDLLNAIERRTSKPKMHLTSAHFSPGPDCRARIVELLHRSKEAVDICVFTVTDNLVCEAIEALHSRQVKVRIITDNHKSNDYGSDIERLARLGIPVKMDDTEYHMHHKFAIFDQSLILTGSYNWTRSAANSNNENLIVMDEQVTVRSFIAEFNRLWETLQPFND